jgi:hypothetical protein
VLAMAPRQLRGAEDEEALLLPGGQAHPSNRTRLRSLLSARPPDRSHARPAPVGRSGDVG